ncbi:hypothetical protein [Cryobacterium sp. Y57]|uniref:hypothetical protein n=1 Tax=Cryobacterium sp. Y57 TaxID=2048287 RepID=UPI000CE53DD3|nr:hypothetical protein [Cryobacterium sp. Y57]
MSNRTDAPLSLTIFGLFFIGLGVWTALSGSNIWLAAGYAGLGITQAVCFERRYLRKRRV